MTKKFAITSLILTMLSTNVWASDCTAPNLSAWPVCSKDSECAVIADACGRFMSVNSQFAQEAESYYQCIAPMIDCPAIDPSQNKDDVRAACIDQNCTLLSPDQ